MIRKCRTSDNSSILQIINDAAAAYKGVIPADCWNEPYMAHDYLLHEIESGVRFWGCETDGELAGVMGIQRVQDVVLIRHAYVRTADQGQGIGGRLLKFLCRRLPEIATTVDDGLAMTEGVVDDGLAMTGNNVDDLGAPNGINVEGAAKRGDRVLVGTWAVATWAIEFYKKHGFQLVSREDKDRLLKKYWSIPHRQIETSVVLDLKRSSE